MNVQEQLAELAKREAVRAHQRAMFHARQAERLEALIASNASEAELDAYYERQLEEWRALDGIISIRALRAPRKPGVYAIQAGHFVKIGRSVNIAKRLEGLQTSHPQRLRLVAILSDSPSDEIALHERFASLRVKGEWFHLRGAVLDAIFEARGWS